MKFDLPAYPLITIDPYFNVYSFKDELNKDHTRHLSHVKKEIKGILELDDEKFLFLGKDKNIKLIKQSGHEYSFLNNIYRFKNDIIEFEVNFFNPLFSDDLDELSLPITYINVKVLNIFDNKKHNIIFKFFFNKEFVYDLKEDAPINVIEAKDDKLDIKVMYKEKQNVLEVSGDFLRINWGYLYVATTKENKVEELNIDKDKYLVASLNLSNKSEDKVVVSYDDIYALNYYGTFVRSYWYKNYSSMQEVLDKNFDKYDEFYQKSLVFEKNLADLAYKSGKDYLKHILIGTYRQVISAHKLAIAPDGEILFISKENFSNGCAATVDLTYPSIPMFLLLNPVLIKGMVKPIIDFANSNLWKFNFAPHDAGRYPILYGNVYGLNKKYEKPSGVFNTPLTILNDADIFDEHMQMPIEESANLIIVMGAYYKETGDIKYIEDNFDLIYKWANYLKEFGLDPEDQLCTDDFAGHLKGNVNLSVKAIMALREFSDLAKSLKKVEISKEFLEISENFAATWLEKSIVNGESILNFGNNDSWSIKYNMIWDSYFKFNLFSEEFKKQELSNYLKHANEYGIPLDSRKTYTKVDWLMWISCFDKKGTNRIAVYKHICKFLNKKKTRYVFSDWYDTISGDPVVFRARSVLGANFMPILIDRKEK